MYVEGGIRESIVLQHGTAPLGTRPADRKMTRTKRVPVYLLHISYDPRSTGHFGLAKALVPGSALVERGGGERREVHSQSGGHELIKPSMEENLTSTASVDQNSSNEPGDQNEAKTRQRDGGAHRS